MSFFSRVLAAVHAHPRWSLVGLLGYAAAVTFPHENVQWVVNEIAIRISHQSLYRVSALIALAQAALFSLVVLGRLRRQPARGTLAVFWFLTLALIGFAWRALTANNVELVHYPQYVPEGILFMALTLSPAESLAWIAILGGLDECYQYAVLSWSRPVPYDFNDVFMDLLGGAVGVMLAMMFLRCERRGAGTIAPALWKRPGIRALFAVVVAGVLLWATGFMALFADPTNTHYWFALSRFRAPAFFFHVVANGPNKYHTLSPIEGPILILTTIAVYAILDRRVRPILPK